MIGFGTNDRHNIAVHHTVAQITVLIARIYLSLAKYLVPCAQRLRGIAQVGLT
jgi:hypothetical protein